MQDWNIWMYDDRPIAEQMKELAKRNNATYLNLREEILDEIKQKALQGKRYYHKVILGYNSQIVKQIIHDLTDENFKVNIKELNVFINRYELDIYW